VGFEPTANL